MKITLAIIGYIFGIFIGIIILAMMTAASNQDFTSNSFVFGNICGIICAIIGYKMPKNKNPSK